MKTPSGFGPLQRKSTVRTTEPELDGITEDARSNLKGLKWLVAATGLVVAGALVAHYILKLF